MTKDQLDLLLSIGRAIASVRDKVALLKIIFDEIKPILGFHDVGLFIVSEEENYHIDLAGSMPEISPSTGNYSVFEQQLQKIPHRNSVVDWTIQELTETGHPILADFADLVERFPDYPQWATVTSLDYRDCLAARLTIQGQTIGMFCINSLEKNKLAGVDRWFFQAITDQLAIALNNILANEQLIEEKKFKETLLTISQAIASIQDRKKLFKVIFERIQPLVKFDNFGLFHLDESGKYHRDLAVADELDLLNKTGKTAGLGGYLPHDGSVDIFIQQGPMIISLEELMERYPGHPFYPLMHKNGLKQVFGGPLIYRGEKIGMLAFNSKQENFYSEKDFPLFQAIADQLSIAVSNVLANEQLIKEKNFKETLLSISEAVATINDRFRLLTVVYERIRPIIPYDAYGLFVLSEDGQQHYELINAEMMDHPAQIAIEQQYGAHTRYIHAGTPVEAMMQEGPSLFRVEDYLAYPQAPLMYEAGLRQIMGGPLVYGGKPIGALCFNSKKENFYQQHDIPIFRAIAEQLSVAVANILAHEQVLAEKAKVEKLHTISEVMASIQYQHQLKTAFDRIARVFPFDGAGLFVLDETGEYHYELLDSETLGGEVGQAQLEARFGKHALYRHTGSPIEAFMQKPGPALVSVKESQTQFPDYPHWGIIEEAGFQQFIVCPLKQGEEVIGLLNFNSKQTSRYRKTDFAFFQSIAEQMSTVVKTILANEHIRRREQENVLQIAMVNALNEGSDWEDKLRRVVQLFQPFIPFDLVTVILNEERHESLGYAFQRVGFEEYRAIDIPTLLKMTQLDRESFVAHITKNTYSKSVIENDWDFKEALTRSPVKRAMHRGFGVNSVMIVPLGVGNNRRMYISFHSNDAHCYREEHRALLERIKTSLTLAIEKQLNYQEVLRLNELISQENAYLEEELQLNYNFEEIIGGSSAMQQVFEKVHQVAYTNSSVLITGETGTGKELIARALHNYSNRSKHNFIKLNCATLPAQLLESELFGHERGAFTGATQRRIGKFELAHQGTIFLDEIGEMPLELQTKLLRVLQEREFERLGGNEVIRTNVRILAATNRNLQKEVADSNFRRDLYYRLNVFPIHLPPLRDRKEDILELTQHFIQKHNKRIGKQVKKLSDKALKSMLVYPWPGNIRELEHVIERAIITAKTTILEIALEESSNTMLNSEEKPQPLKTYRQSEIDLIMNTLQFTNGKISGVGGAAEILDINPSTLESRIRKLGIKKKHFVDHNPEEGSKRR